MSESVQCQAIAVSTGNRCTKTYVPKAGTNPNYCHLHQAYVPGKQEVISTPTAPQKTRISAEQSAPMEAERYLGGQQRGRTRAETAALNPVGVYDTAFNTDAAPNYGVAVGAQPTISIRERISNITNSAVQNLSAGAERINQSFSEAATKLGQQANQILDRVPLMSPAIVEVKPEEEKYQPDIDYQLARKAKTEQNVQSSSSKYTPAVNPKYLNIPPMKEEFEEPATPSASAQQREKRQSFKEKSTERKRKESISKKRTLDEAIVKIVDSANAVVNGIVEYNSALEQETPVNVVRSCENVTASNINELIQSAPVHADVAAMNGNSVTATIQRVTNDLIERNDSQLMQIALSKVSTSSFSANMSGLNDFIRSRDNSQNVQLISQTRIKSQIDQNRLEQSAASVSYYEEFASGELEEEGPLQEEINRSRMFTFEAGLEESLDSPYRNEYQTESSGTPMSRRTSMSAASDNPIVDPNELQGFIDNVRAMIVENQMSIETLNWIQERYNQYNENVIPQLRDFLIQQYGPNLSDIPLQTRREIAQLYPTVYEAVLNPSEGRSVRAQAISASRRRGGTGDPFPPGGPGRFPPGGPPGRGGGGGGGFPGRGPPGGPPPPPGSLPGPQATFEGQNFNYDPALVERFISNLSNYDDRYIAQYVGYISNVNKNITNYVAYGVTQGVAGNQIFTQRVFPLDQLINDLRLQYGNILFTDYFTGVFGPHLEQLRDYNTHIQQLGNMGVNNIQNFLLPIHTPIRPRRTERIPENVISNTNNEIIFQNRPNGGPYSQYLGVYGNIKYPDIPSITITQSKKQIKCFVCTQEGKSRMFKDIHQARGWAIRGGFYADRIERQRRAAEDKYRLPYEIQRKKINAFVSVSQL